METYKEQDVKIVDDSIDNIKYIIENPERWIRGRDDVLKKLSHSLKPVNIVNSLEQLKINLEDIYKQISDYVKDKQEYLSEHDINFF